MKPQLTPDQSEKILESVSIADGAIELTIERHSPEETDDTDVLQTALVDLLAHLMHWVEAQKDVPIADGIASFREVNFQQALRIAQGHYHAERLGLIDEGVADVPV